VLDNAQPSTTRAQPMVRRFDIAGVTWNALAHSLRGRYEEIELVYLEHDPENEYDALAIAVYAKVGDTAFRVGYVPNDGTKTVAHAEDWMAKTWSISGIGTFRPPNLRATAAALPYCRLEEAQ